MFYYDDCGGELGLGLGLGSGRFAMFKHKKMNVSGTRFSVCNNNDSSPEL